MLTRDVALQLLCNTLPTGAVLVVLITAPGPISGAHLNPAVSLVFAARGELPRSETILYIAAQVAGGIAGTGIAHLMFNFPVLELSAKLRTGGGQWFAEGVATFGLVATILRRHPLPEASHPLAGRPVHHLGLLVYRFDQLCKSGGDARPGADAKLFRHSARLCAAFHCCADCGRAARKFACRLAFRVAGCEPESTGPRSAVAAE